MGVKPVGDRGLYGKTGQGGWSDVLKSSISLDGIFSHSDGHYARSTTDVK